MLNEREIIRLVIEQYKLPLSGIHGVAHWARVYENGQLLSDHLALTRPQADVVKLFAMIHDSCRLNEGHDPAHGHRASQQFLKMLVADTDLVDDVPTRNLGALALAMEDHATGKVAPRDYA